MSIATEMSIVRAKQMSIIDREGNVDCDTNVDRDTSVDCDANVY
jgi:hypothetical protein